MSNHVTQLEAQLRDAKELARRRDLAIKLSKNKEFRELILDDYIVAEASRLAAAAGDPNLTEVQQRSMYSMALAPGHLKRYLQVITQMGDTGADSIPEIEEALEDARIEEAAAEAAPALQSDGE